jgi:hypothetical protein
MVPLAPGRDGRTFFATITTPAFSGVARIQAPTGQVTPIKPFPDADNDQAGGAFDGRWLVWREYHSLSNFDDFTVWAWDSQTGSLRKIGAAKQGPDGKFWPSGWRNPDVNNGVATWEQGSGRQGAGEIHVFHLATGPDRVVRRGHPQGPFFVGRTTIVWPESARPGATTVLRGINATTGARTALPKALRAIRGVSALVTDGRAIAYPSSGFTSLWWSPSLSHAPSRIVTAGYGDYIDNSVQIAGRYFLFGIAPHTYLADAATHRYIEISAGGWGRLDAKALVLLPASSKKARHEVTDVLFLPVASLPPVPICR